MKSKFEKVKLSDVVQIKYGKDHKKLNDGTIPVYGTGGIMRWGDASLFDGESVLIPRKGSLNNVYYVTGEFWTVDTIFWTIADESKILPKYLYYYLKTIDLSGMNVGSAVPSLTTALLNELRISLPNIDTQQQMVDMLSVFDDKISANTLVNDNLVA